MRRPLLRAVKKALLFAPKYTEVTARKRRAPYNGDTMATKPGLYANIHKKRERIEKGSGEKMRKPGTKGAPSAKDFKEAAKTAKK